MHVNRMGMIIFRITKYINLTQSPSVTLIVGPGIVSLNVQACGNTKPLLAIGIELFSFMNSVNSDCLISFLVREYVITVKITLKLNICIFELM